MPIKLSQPEERYIALVRADRITTNLPRTWKWTNTASRPKPPTNSLIKRSLDRSGAVWGQALAGALNAALHQLGNFFGTIVSIGKRFR